jgi:hypothetical protein
MGEALKALQGAMAIKEGKMEKLKEAVEKVLRIEDKPPEKPRICTMCRKPATQLVDGEPSCADHVEQVYEHQVEDYTSQHLTDNEWRKV